MSAPTPRTDRQAVVSLGKAWKASYDEMHEHARTLERELATERARLDWLESPAGMHWQWQLGITRATIDAKMQKDAK